MHFNSVAFIPIIILLNLVSHVVSCQKSVNELQEYLTKLKSGNQAALRPSIFEDRKNYFRILATLEAAANDSSQTIRSTSYSLIKTIGINSGNAKETSTAIDLLIRGVDDPDSKAQRRAMESLTAFRKSDFSNEQKRAVGERLQQSNSNLDALVKIIGFLQLYHLQGKLNDLLVASTPVHHRWAIRLALARMSNPDAASYILRKVGAAKIDDDFVYDIIPDLVYTRNPEIFAFLETIVQNDAKTCSSADAGSTGPVTCAYQVMEMIAPVIKEFPVTVDADGELTTSDYPKALATVRVWLASHRGYSIAFETY